ncbi:MAG: N-acetylmuramoyl-L-alanine amidase [Myxococcales bacterium]|nr:N-acetylmuramoyl-L-alanine amidase [Myxococcales bacterium]
MLSLLLSVIGGFSSAMARPLVVLDPGHGGEQNGTTSLDGVHEKVLVLEVALGVRAYLQQASIDVRMTRMDDRDIPNPDRPQLADRLSADAFVSIHLNHSPDPTRRGWETYVLSAEASDARTQQLLEQEEGMSVDTMSASSDLAFILKDLARGATHKRSIRLAKHIQDSVRGRPGLLPSRGLRQGPFVVLSGHKAPGVLVELGYLSNTDQAAFFSSQEGQQEAARILSQGILRFLRTKN